MALVTFEDLMQAVSNVSVSDPIHVRNAAIRQRYAWAITSRGKPMSKSIGGGQQIQFTVRLKNKNSMQVYGDNTPLSAQRVQTLTTGTLPWCQAYAEASWDDKEVVLNGGSMYSDEYRQIQFTKLATNIFAGLTTDCAEGVESFCWATPDPTTMEGASGTVPMAFGSTVNDHYGTAGGINGKFYNSTVAAAFTTVQGINSTDAGKTRWRNRMATYDSSAAKPASGARNVVNAFDDLYQQLNYSPPSMPAGLSVNQWEEDQWPQLVAFTSRRGMTAYYDLIRQQGDRWTSPGNPDPSVGGPRGAGTYGNLELFYIPALDTASLYLSDYTSGTPTNTDQFAGQGKGPRYHLYNLSAKHVVFHMDRHFKKTEPRQYDFQPFSNTIWVDTYLNVVDEARWLHGIISPGTLSGEFPSHVYTATSVYTS